MKWLLASYTLLYTFAVIVGAAVLLLDGFTLLNALWFLIACVALGFFGAQLMNEVCK